jgi:hypothetical protein
MAARGSPAWGARVQLLGIIKSGKGSRARPLRLRRVRHARAMPQQDQPRPEWGNAKLLTALRFCERVFHRLLGEPALRASSFLKLDEELSPSPGKMSGASLQSRRLCPASRTPFPGSRSRAKSLGWSPARPRARSIPGRDGAKGKEAAARSRLHTHDAPVGPCTLSLAELPWRGMRCSLPRPPPPVAPKVRAPARLQLCFKCSPPPRQECCGCHARLRAAQSPLVPGCIGQ